MKRLTTVTNSIDATFLQHRLDQEGIVSFVTNENISSLLPHFDGILGNGIQIMVREEDFEDAKHILQEQQNSKQPKVCPNCGSSNIGFGLRGKDRIGDKVLIFFSLMFAIPMGNIKNKHYCKNCKEDVHNLTVV
jgi:hypothetical protein